MNFINQVELHKSEKNIAELIKFETDPNYMPHKQLKLYQPLVERYPVCPGALFFIIIIYPFGISRMPRCVLCVFLRDRATAARPTGAPDGWAVVPVRHESSPNDDACMDRVTSRTRSGSCISITDRATCIL